MPQSGASSALSCETVVVETTAGVLNPIHDIGVGLASLRRPAAGGAPPTFIVDSLSGFGAYPVDVLASRIHFLVSSSNKCLEGVPGFSFAIACAAALAACKGNARSLALDLHAQGAGLDVGGQFRFTPPTHALLAFDAALQEHAAEGGVRGRYARYAANHAALIEGMAALGFRPFVSPDASGVIITTFLVPDDARFNFGAAYTALAARGFVLYPGKTTAVESFRIGSIGRIYEQDMRDVVAAFRDTLLAQGVALPVKQKLA